MIVCPARFPVTKRRLSSSLLACTVAASTAATIPAAAAETAPAPASDGAPAAVDVRFEETPAPHRTLSIEWNPLALFIDRFSVNVVVVPGDHHALVLSPFYTWANTAEYSTNLGADGTALGYVLNVPKQTFNGFGGDIGYRYYFAKGGPRGFFVGPSLILADITATAHNGNQTSFFDVGAAADVGFQALLGDAVSISIGGGLQYTFYQSQSIPPQQLPASTVANERLYPRLLLSFGYAF